MNTENPYIKPERFENRSLISLGTNMGDRNKNLDDALYELSGHSQILIKKTGRRLNNKAIIIEDQPDFLNQIAEIMTSLDPHSLLRACLSIEEKLGRVRTLRYGPRIIDLDILTYNDLILHSDTLTLPHPGLKDRDYLKILMEEFL